MLFSRTSQRICANATSSPLSRRSQVPYFACSSAIPVDGLLRSRCFAPPCLSCMELTADRVDIAEERTLQVRHDKKLHTFEGNQQEHFSFFSFKSSFLYFCLLFTILKSVDPSCRSLRLTLKNPSSRPSPVLLY